MHDRLHLPDDLRVIVVTRLDALGDIVLGTQLLNGLHTKWPAAEIQLIVRPALAGAGGILPNWVKVVPFPFDPRDSIGGREHVVAQQLKRFATGGSIDLLIVAEYNRVWADEIFAAWADARRVVAFDGPTGINASHHMVVATRDADSSTVWTLVHVTADQRESEKHAALLATLGIDPASEPSIQFDEDARAQAIALWNATGVDPAQSLIVFPSSGEQGVRSLDADVWQRWIARLSLSRPVILLGSDLDLAVLDAIQLAGAMRNVFRVVVPPRVPGVAAAFIDCCSAYIGMDTGPAHLAAVLGKPTLVIYGGGHRADRFLPVGRRAAAVRMPIGCYGCDWLCPFNNRLCIKLIPEAPLFDIGEKFLAGLGENDSVFNPRVFDISAPPSLAGPQLGPIMRQHRQFLKLNHDLVEHHAYLAATSSTQQSLLERLAPSVDALADQNHRSAAALADVQRTLTVMTAQNQSRDEAISHLNQAMTDLTIQNKTRDISIARGQDALAAMTRQNEQRDLAIASLNATMSEMTMQNTTRDQAIQKVSEPRTFWQRIRGK